MRRVSRAHVLVERLDDILREDDWTRDPSFSEPPVSGGISGLQSIGEFPYTSKNPQIKHDMRMETSQDAYTKYDKRQQDRTKREDDGMMNKFHATPLGTQNL